MATQQAVRTIAFGFTLLFVLALVVAQSASAQTESVLYSFCPKGGGCPDGYSPGGLVADSAGNLYGPTYYGGTGNGGVAFKLTPSGQESLLYTFSRAPHYGWDSQGRLLLDKQGNLYGTTSKGGTNSLHFQTGDGIAFKLSPDGTETTLYNFGAYNTDGAQPAAGLVMDAGGNFYGTTFFGGVYTHGTLFRLTPDGAETILHNFAFDGTDGFYPAGSLLLDSSGNLYGTTTDGGAYDAGTVFEVTAEGSYRVLYSFDGAAGDGVIPLTGLTLDSTGNLYGVTYRGGAYDNNQDGGTVFKLSPSSNSSWTETLLYNFGQNSGSCQEPDSNVLFDAEGNLYGTTTSGGTWGGGCAYKLSPTGKLTILHAFGASGDADFPSGNIVFSHGNLYGTAGGGAYAEGAVFKITIGK
jgi:uncharacterized repeat protein (TIGR03803 family)